ncbi:TPA: hypothetical protein DCQ82_01805 [Candidatus Veblenbacteria bacterium]|nr:hypothetical protein [Candidatus Veblenbacteria bacterium]
MVCKNNLQILKEYSSMQSASALVNSFWQIATRVSDNTFINKIGLNIKDDHTPLNTAGIPSILLIDYHYPSFHTTNDTLDKCSANSLEIITQSVLNYLYSIE